MTEKWTEGRITALLRRRYCVDKGNGPAAVLLPQVRNRAGFDATRTADAIVMHLWPSKGLAIEGFEIKCSRTDLLRELNDPTKAEAFARYCDRWWLVVAETVNFETTAIPRQWGIMTATADGVRVRRQAPPRPNPEQIPKSLLACILREADREAGRARDEIPAPTYGEWFVDAQRRGFLTWDRQHGYIPTDPDKPAQLPLTEATGR